jgi:hypothetical protein
MAQFSFGPIYCEDYIARASFPIEPFNTVSNGVIVLFGLAAAYVVAKRAPRAVDLYLLAGLLVFTGVGSGMWHGLRDPIALRFEVLSGLFFLFAMIFIWARRLWGYLGAGILILVFYLGFQYSQMFVNAILPIQGRWVAIAPLVLTTGFLLIQQTAGRSRQAAITGAVALASALTALGFRTYDIALCPYIPVGTHFLWHMLLSAAGFVGVLALIRLPAGAPKLSRPKSVPAEEPAE